MANSQEDMKQLTPMDIHNKEFRERGRNGYDRYEVDSFLDQIVDDYGDALDQVVDLKNEVVALNKQTKHLNDKLAVYQQKEHDANQILVSAQSSANKIKVDAENTAKQMVDQAKIDVSYQKQQKEVIEADYKRLKREIGEFRTHIQSMLQAQIDNLSDEAWQHALDKYFKTDRLYPGDGGEPLPLADPQDEEFAKETDFDDDDFDESDFDEFDDFDDDEASEVDNDNPDDVNSYQEANEDSDAPKPMTGDSSNHETINLNMKPETKRDSSGPTIIFPDDYKDHK